MRASLLRAFLHRFLAGVVCEVQLTFFCRVVLALIEVQRATFNEIARVMCGGGDSMAASLSQVYRGVNGMPGGEAWSSALANLLLANTNGRLILATDWTDVGHFKILVTGVVSKGRVLPLLWTVMHLRGDQVHSELLHYETLGSILPAGRDYVLLGDRGFGHPRTIDELSRRGISFVLRTKVGNSIGRPGDSEEAFVKIQRIRYEIGAVQDFGFIEFCKTKRVRVRLIRSGLAGHKEPWTLLTDLDAPPRVVVRLYGLRFQIEATFRDLKNPRYGFGLSGHLIHVMESMIQLFSLSVVVYWVLYLVGLHARKRGWQLDYQSNSNQRELAAWRVGRFVATDASRAHRIGLEHLLDQIQNIPLKTGQWHWEPRPAEVLTSWPIVQGPHPLRQPKRKKRTARPCDVLMAKRLRLLLAQNNLTQAALAQKVDRSEGNLTAILGGWQALPEAWIPKVAAAFGITRKALIAGTGWSPGKFGRPRNKVSPTTS